MRIRTFTACLLIAALLLALTGCGLFRRPDPKEFFHPSAANQDGLCCLIGSSYAVGGPGG